MNDNVYLTKMTRAIAEAYFKEFCFDDAVFLCGQTVTQFNYSDEWLDDYLAKKRNCVHLAVMRHDKPIGEILFKRIDPVAGTAVFSIHLQNDSVKGKGYGTYAEKLAIKYAFSELKLNGLYRTCIFISDFQMPGIVRHFRPESACIFFCHRKNIRIQFLTFQV